jgi:hypothetical protein
LTPRFDISAIFLNDLTWGIADHEVAAIAGLDEHQGILVSLRICSDENGRRIEPRSKPIGPLNADKARRWPTHARSRAIFEGAFVGVNSGLP